MRKAYYFKGDKGEIVKEEPIPESLLDQVEKKRSEMIEMLGNVDDEIGEMFIMEEEPDVETLKAAIRRNTISNKFVPVFMGSAFKNRGVQPLLDGVVDYLPNPAEVQNFAHDLNDNEKSVPVICDHDKPLVALAFKLEESRFGQLTYMRVYQGRIKKGGTLLNVKTAKKIKVPRLVKMHSNEMVETNEVGAGDVVAMFGVDCSSMDSFTDGTCNWAMTSMFVPNPVMSLSVVPKDTALSDKFGKAIGRFCKEDPTLRVHTVTKKRDR
jgi:elongation factor G